MQRKDVADREADWYRWKRGVAIEALAKERGVTRERMRIRLAKMDENMTQLALLTRAEQAEAERDAAFAAGQEEMRERAEELYASDDEWDYFHAFVYRLRALSIKDRAE